MNNVFMTYPGGKNGSGTYQKLINLMPPHRMYVEAFLGGGAIMRAKRPAGVNVGIDMDGAVIREWRANLPAGTPNLTLLQADSVTWLAERADTLGADCLVYCDPPYLMSTRSSQRQFYTVEMAEESQHRAMIRVLRSLNCLVILSGYWSELYDDLLGDWRTFSFQAMTRGGTMATEWVWMNYPAPVTLHDYRYLGDTFRERESFKKQKARWAARLEQMPVLKRQALLMAIQEMDANRANSAGSNAVSGDASSQEEIERRQLSLDEAMGSGSSGNEGVDMAASECRTSPNLVMEG